MSSNNWPDVNTLWGMPLLCILCSSRFREFSVSDLRLGMGLPTAGPCEWIEQAPGVKQRAMVTSTAC